MKSDSLDFLIINTGRNNNVYQSLELSESAIEQPTMSLLALSYLTKAGFSVNIIDAAASTISDDEICKLVELYNPLLIGIYVYGYHPSSSTQNMPSANNMVSLIKGNNPCRKIVMCGTHPAALPEITLRESELDFVSCREGMKSIEQLVSCIKNNGDLRAVQDLWYKDDDDIKFTYYGKLLDFDEINYYLDMPRWDLLDMSVYRAHNWHTFGSDIRKRYASIYTSFGCPYKCIFCCVNSPYGNMLNGPRIYRLFSPLTIINQIDELVNKYNVYNIKIIDEMFVLNEKHVSDICDLIIERGYKLNIWAYARIDSVTDKLLEKLKLAGFKWLAIGVESGNKLIRNEINKNYTDDNVISAINKIKKFDINITASFIFGLRDDTIQTMEYTLEFAQLLNIEHVNFYSAMAYPGSPLYNTAINSGWNLPTSWLGYSQYSYECFPLGTKYISNAEVLKFRDNAFKLYNTSSKYLNTIENKFGSGAINSIKSLLQYTLKRKLLGD